MKDTPFARLMVDLLAKEDKCEKALTVEHVEDKLIYKQILMQDEESYLNDLNAIVDIPVLFDTRNYPHGFLHRIVGDIALLNRQRRNFRLFRDWQEGGRPW